MSSYITAFCPSPSTFFHISKRSSSTGRSPFHSSSIHLSHPSTSPINYHVQLFASSVFFKVKASKQLPPSPSPSPFNPLPTHHHHHQHPHSLVTHLVDPSKSILDMCLSKSKSWAVSTLVIAAAGFLALVCYPQHATASQLQDVSSKFASTFTQTSHIPSKQLPIHTSSSYQTDNSNYSDEGSSSQMPFCHATKDQSCFVLDGWQGEKILLDGWGNLIQVKKNNPFLLQVRWEGYKSFQSSKETIVLFENRTNELLDVFWVNFNGEEELFNVIQPGGSYIQVTYQSHPWSVRDHITQNNRLFMVASDKPTMAIVTPERKDMFVDSTTDDETQQNHHQQDDNANNIALAQQQASLQLVSNSSEAHPIPPSDKLNHVYQPPPPPPTTRSHLPIHSNQMFL